MSAFYARLKGTADSLLARFGAPVTLTRTDRFGNVSTRSGTMVVAGTVQRVLEGARVELGDLELLVSADAAPEAGDVFERGGQRYVIRQDINPIQPAAVVLAYECHAGPA